MWAKGQYNKLAPPANIQTEASRIWESTPTPLYEEFMSKRKATTVGPYNKYLPEDQALFWQYVQRLKDTYPSCKVDVDPRGPTGSRSGNTSQTFESSGGQNYYRQFQRAEKACQIQQVHKRFLKVADPYGRSGKKTANKEMPIQTIQNLQQYLQEKQKEKNNAEKQRLANQEEQRKEKEKEEKRRFASVKQGNLLGLTASPEPNLLSFGPTNAMIKSRANELSSINFSSPNITHANFVAAGIEIEPETVERLTKNQRNTLLSRLKGMNKSQHNNAINSYLQETVLRRGGRKTRKTRKLNTRKLKRKV